MCLYVHIPFCERVCPYCDFAVVALDEGDADVSGYTRAVVRELQMADADRSRLTTFAFLSGIAGILIALGGILGVQIGLWPPLFAFAIQGLIAEPDLSALYATDAWRLWSF